MFSWRWSAEPLSIKNSNWSTTVQEQPVSGLAALGPDIYQQSTYSQWRRHFSALRWRKGCQVFWLGQLQLGQRSLLGQLWLLCLKRNYEVSVMLLHLSHTMKPKQSLKGRVHPKMKIQSLFIHIHADGTVGDFSSPQNTVVVQEEKGLQLSPKQLKQMVTRI